MRRASTARLAALTAFALIAFAALAAGGAMAAFPGENGRIAHVRYLSGSPPASGFEIFTVNPDGSDLRQITDLPGHAVTPSWSPDGRMIAFARLTQAGASVWTINADGGELRRVTGPAHGATDPSFSPDGRRVVYSSENVIRSVRLDGSDRDLVFSPPADRCCVADPAFSPDGRRIALGRRGPSSWKPWTGIWSVRPDASGLRRLTAPKRPLYDFAPDFSPDGRRIVLGRHRYEIHVTRADGKGERRLEGQPFLSFDPAFAPSGDRIVGVSGDYVTLAKTPCSRLFTMPAAGGEPQFMPGACGDVFSPDWQPLPGPSAK